MEQTTANKGIHPCFSRGTGDVNGVLRLSVAPGCNMSCRFCIARGDARNAETSIRILAPGGAMDRVAALIVNSIPPAGVEIAGPGEPLVNADALMVLRQLHWLYPHLPLSVWTNGLLLPERLVELLRSRVTSLTVSINAVFTETAGRLYDWIVYRGRRLEGRDAAEVLLHQQWGGIASAIKAGITVTVCSVVIPGVNEHEVPLIGNRARGLGVDSVMTVPLSD